MTGHYGWSLPVLPLVAIAVGAAAFVHAFARLRSRGRPDLAPWSRAWLFVLALGVAGAALVTPLDGIAEEYLLSAHMLQHVLIADVAPALAVLAVRGPLVFHLLPRAVLASLAKVGLVRAVFRTLVRPSISFAVWGVAFLAWHAPRAYDFALAHPWAHALEHVSFVVGGVLAWSQLVDPARRNELSVGGRIAFGVGMIALGQLLTDTLVFASSPYYGPYADQPERLLGLSPLADQRLAGLVMMVEQLAAVGTAIGVLLWPYLTRRERPAFAEPR